MGAFNNIEDILDFAINEEIGAAVFYRELAGRADNAALKAAFEEFAAEEEGHKAKLQQVKAGGKLAATAGAGQADLKISDYLVEIEPDEELDTQKAYILAMRKEKSAFKLYSDLAACTTDPALKDLLTSLAREEARHKLKLELEYDSHYNIEN